MQNPDILKVDLQDRSYNIVIGSDLIKNVGQFIPSLIKNTSVIIITDQNVADFHLSKLVYALDAEKLAYSVVTLPPGESTKEFNHFQNLISKILDKNPERSTSLIALGGGVVGDLAGFAASIILRGINYFQIPTTLLAQVDSSVGGKTGVNSEHGKNLIGTFYQPKGVLIDTNVLATLSKRELLAGYAEVVKYGIIGDKKFFEWLEINGEALIKGDEGLQKYAIMESCRAKAKIVNQDEKETGNRALLNFGHTFGHALEAEMGYSSRLLHGEAVAIGMLLAFDLSVLMGFCAKEEAARVQKHFLSMGLPTQLDDILEKNYDSQVLLDHMARDKKVKNGQLNFILTRGVGNAFITSEVERESVIAVLNRRKKIKYPQ